MILLVCKLLAALRNLRQAQSGLSSHSIPLEVAVRLIFISYLPLTETLWIAQRMITQVNQLSHINLTTVSEPSLGKRVWFSIPNIYMSCMISIASFTPHEWLKNC